MRPLEECLEGCFSRFKVGPAVQYAFSAELWCAAATVPFMVHLAQCNRWPRGFTLGKALISISFLEKKCGQGVQVMSASISCRSFKLAPFTLFLAVSFLTAQVLAWREQMARVQNRKEGHRIELYPNPLILFGTVESPTQV